jgi:hypothetical protein
MRMDAGERRGMAPIDRPRAREWIAASYPTGFYQVAIAGGNIGSGEFILMQLFFSKHALQRVGERFGFKSKYKIPQNELLQLGLAKQEGEVFYVRLGSVVFVCKRVLQQVIVITVIRYKKT